MISFVSKCLAVLVAVGCIAASPAHAQKGNVVIDPPATSAEEVSIAIDPANPNNLIAGANIRFAYHSSNGGRSWWIDTLSSQFGVWGDPCLMFDDQGTAYYVHLSNPPGGRWIDRIVVATSTDGGVSWPHDVGVGLRNGTQMQDKAWLACDRSHSARRGTMYMAWTEFDLYASTVPTDSSRIRFSRSTDHGTRWTEPITISRLSGDCIDSDTTDEGAVPAADTNGDVHVMWADRRGIVYASSPDGGLTFGQDRVLAGTVEGWDFPVSGLYRANGLPTMLTDFSNGPHRGTMYIVWSDRWSRHGEAPAPGIQILMMRSTDNGATWSAPRIVNADSTGRDHVFPAVAIDGTTGVVYIVYYDRRRTAGDATEVWISRSGDGGVTFRDSCVSESPFTPSASTFTGDYIGIAAGNHRVFPIWTRFDGTIHSVLTSVMLDSAGLLSVQKVSTLPLAVTLAQNFPNPFDGRTASTAIQFSVNTVEAAQDVLLTICDVAGRNPRTLLDGRVAAGAHTVVIPAGTLSRGAYLYRLRTAAGVEERVMTVE